MNHQNHFFFAASIPEETKDVMRGHMEKLRRAIPFGRWVHPQDLHITLAFLGSAESEKLSAAEMIVKEAIRDAKAITLNINNLGIFGSAAAPRVFWADTEESGELISLRKKVFTACESAGFALETRPFRPHITLARKWAGTAPFQTELLEVWRELQPEPLSFTMKDVVLYQTHLQNSPKYEAKVIVPLNTRK